MFKIKKVQPMFTRIVTTARTYVGGQTTKGGIILDTTRMDGSMNPFQTVIAIGTSVHGIKEGDVVKLDFRRYVKAKHVPGDLDAANNVRKDNYTMAYEIPCIEINDQQYLLLQDNDVEYVVSEYEVDEGGLFQ